MTGDRTAILLGAGASVDAGLKVTTDLAQAIVSNANDQHRSDWYPRPTWVRALNAVYAGMVGHRGASGSNPLDAVNIETLISAVRILKNRDEHEVAPFVSAWLPSVTDIGEHDSQLPHRAGQNIVRAIERLASADKHRRGGAPEREISEAVAAISRSAMRGDLARTFERVEDFVIDQLVNLLREHEDVGYLQPIIDFAGAQEGGVDVLTLNYDLTIEAAAGNAGVTVWRGVADWKPGDDIHLPDRTGQLNLLKLHGSLDWVVETTGMGYSSHLAPRQVREVPVESDAQRRRAPWIVVGDREKLATDGPTLALNHAARAALRRADHLAIVGYSFHDNHMNQMIRDWFNADDRRTISVLDLSWTGERGMGGGPTFRDELKSHALLQGADGRGANPRVVLLEGAARERLADTLTARPETLPAELVDGTVTRLVDRLRLNLTWHGPGLSEARIFADLEPRRGGGSVDVIEKGAQPVRDSLWAPSRLSEVEVGDWNRGASVVVDLVGDINERLRVDVRGRTVVGRLYGALLLDGGRVLSESD